MSEWEYVSDNVVSALVNNPTLFPKVATHVSISDLDGRSADVYRLITDLAIEDVPWDVTVLGHAWIERRMNKSWASSTILDLYTMNVSAQSLDYHLDRLLALGALEKLGSIGSRLSQMAASSSAVPAEIGASIMESLTTTLSRLERPHDVTLTTLQDVRAYEMPPARWLFPGMLKRQQRAMFVAGEGMGKSTLLAQMAFAGAAGINPFTIELCPPIRTMIVDAENSYDDAMENWQLIDTTMRKRNYPQPADRIAFEPRGAPLDLSSPNDQGWLRTRIEAHRPDLLVIGPLYLLTEDSLIEEAGMTRLLQFFAKLRSDYDLSIVLESHAGNESGGHARQMRPYGSSVQRRNMEFGFGLIRSADLSDSIGVPIVRCDPWRGSRSRHVRWPTHFSQTTNGDVWWDDASDRIDTMGSF